MSHFAPRALLLSLGLAAAACGGPERSLPPIAPAPVAACLTLVVAEEGPRADAYDRQIQKAVRASFEEAMVGAGFNVLGDPALPHDLLATVTIDAGSRIASGSRVTATLTLTRNGQTIDRLEASAPRETPGYEGAVADALVDGLFRSGGLATFTRSMRNPKSRDHLAASALRVALAPPPAAPASPAPVVAEPPPPVALPAAPAAALAGAPQPKAYALVIGVESYKNAPRVAGARADAERFADLARRSLGVPAAQVRVLLDEKADKLGFELNIEWLKINVPRGGRVYFFFSGHGALRRQTMTEHLLPQDGDPKAPDRTAIALPAFLQALGQTQAKDVIAFVDAGYSGAGPRSASVVEGKPPAVISDPEVPPRVALLSAVTSAETAGDAGGGGLFTRYLVEALGAGRADFDGDGRITLHELATWLAPRVAREARREKRAQTPSLLLGPGAGPATQVVVASGIAGP